MAALIMYSSLNFCVTVTTVYNNQLYFPSFVSYCAVDAVGSLEGSIYTTTFNRHVHVHCLYTECTIPVVLVSLSQNNTPAFWVALIASINSQNTHVKNYYVSLLCLLGVHKHPPLPFFFGRLHMYRQAKDMYMHKALLLVHDQMHTKLMHMYIYICTFLYV